MYPALRQHVRHGVTWVPESSECPPRDLLPMPVAASDSVNLQLAPDGAEVGPGRLVPRHSSRRCTGNKFFQPTLVPVRRQRPTYACGGRRVQILMNGSQGDQTTNEWIRAGRLRFLAWPSFDRHQFRTIIDMTSESLSTSVRNAYRHRQKSAPRRTSAHRYQNGVFVRRPDTQNSSTVADFVALRECRFADYDAGAHITLHAVARCAVIRLGKRTDGTQLV